MGERQHLDAQMLARIDSKHHWRPTKANSNSAISAVHRPVFTVLKIRRDTRFRDRMRSAFRFFSKRCTIATAMVMSTSAEAERSEISMPYSMCRIRMVEWRDDAHQSLPVMRQCVRERGVQSSSCGQRPIWYTVQHVALRSMDEDCACTERCIAFVSCPFSRLFQSYSQIPPTKP